MGRFDEAKSALRTAEAVTGHTDQSLMYYTGASSSPPSAALSHEALPDVWLTQVASPAECAEVIAMCEAHADSRGGWGNPPPRYAPAVRTHCSFA